MAIQRSTVAQLITEIRRNIGEPVSVRSHVPDSSLYVVMNRYLQGLSLKVEPLVRGEGVSIEKGTLKLDMYFQQWSSQTTVANDVVVAPDNTDFFYLPNNYDQYYKFYDNNEKRELRVITSSFASQRTLERLKQKAPGPPEAVQITGYVTHPSDNTYWLRKVYYWPTVGTYTPSLLLEGWRLPAKVTSSAHYIDIDPKYEDLFVAGVTATLLRKDDPNYSRFQELERELLLPLAATARAA